MQLEYEVPKIVLDSPVDLPANFWERFKFSFEQNAEQVFTDRFHSLNTTQWYMALADRNAAEIRDATSRAARQAFSRSVTVSFREASFDLPIMLWLEGQRGFWADLVLQSVDTVGEEAVSPLNPAYGVLERSWWNRMAESHGLHYGIRPFRTSPYAFVSAGIWSDETLFVLVHLRYHFQQFTEHKFELALSVPLAHGFAIDVGTAYQFGRETEQRQMVLKLSKQMRNGGILYVGMEAQQRPTFLVGVALPL